MMIHTLRKLRIEIFLFIKLSIEIFDLFSLLIFLKSYYYFFLFIALCQCPHYMSDFILLTNPSWDIMLLRHFVAVT